MQEKNKKALNEHMAEVTYFRRNAIVLRATE